MDGGPEISGAETLCGPSGMPAESCWAFEPIRHPSFTSDNDLTERTSISLLRRICRFHVLVRGQDDERRNIRFLAGSEGSSDFVFDGRYCLEVNSYCHRVSGSQM